MRASMFCGQEGEKSVGLSRSVSKLEGECSVPLPLEHLRAELPQPGHQGQVSTTLPSSAFVYFTSLGSRESLIC